MALIQVGLLTTQHTHLDQAAPVMPCTAHDGTAHHFHVLWASPCHRAVHVELQSLAIVSTLGCPAGRRVGGVRRRGQGACAFAVVAGRRGYRLTSAPALHASSPGGAAWGGAGGRGGPVAAQVRQRARQMCAWCTWCAA